MVDQMQFLYGVMANLSEMDLPVVFKGYLVLNMVIEKSSHEVPRRFTMDMDMYWDGGGTLEEIASLIEIAVKNANKDYSVRIRRSFTDFDGSTACVDILDSKGKLFSHVDIDQNAAHFKETYDCCGVSVQGVHPHKIVADKIAAISSRKVFRRAKDLLDLYDLIQLGIAPDIDTLNEIWKKDQRAIDDFSCFTQRRADLEHAYEKLRDVIDRPEFHTVYTVLKQYFTELGLISRDS